MQSTRTPRETTPGTFLDGMTAVVLIVLALGVLAFGVVAYLAGREGATAAAAPAVAPDATVQRVDTAAAALLVPEDAIVPRGDQHLSLIHI